MNIFEKPVEKDTLEDWAKMMIDIAKVAILAIPVILYGKDSLEMKIINCTLVVVISYLSLFAHRILRKKLKQEKEWKE